MDTTSLVENYLLRVVDGTPNVRCLTCEGIVPYRESSFYLTSDYPVGVESGFFFLCPRCQQEHVAEGVGRVAIEKLTERALWDNDEVAFAVLRESFDSQAVNANAS